MKITIDLGGTNVRAALIDHEQILRMVSESCKSDGTEEEVLEQIANLVASLMNDQVTAIGIGVPSVVDTAKGIVYDVLGIPSWKEVHLKEFMEKRFGIPLYLENDCNCFSLGVSNFAEGKDYREVVCVTLGTGVGSSLVIDGKLYSGHNTGAGEIGNIPYLDKDYEFYCSSRFFVSRGTSGKQAAIDARNNDPEALRLWQEFGKHIGCLVTLIIYAYDPEAIIFGGSIASAFDLYKDSMSEELKNCIYQKSVRKIHILPSKGDNMALLGASVLA